MNECMDECAGACVPSVPSVPSVPGPFLCGAVQSVLILSLLTTGAGQNKVELPLSLRHRCLCRGVFLVKEKKPRINSGIE